MTGIEIIAAVGLAASAVAGVVSAVGQSQAMKAQAKAKDIEAQVDQRNALIARRQAAQDAADSRLETRRRLASVRAAYGSKGFTLSGSPLEVLRDAATEGELDAQRAIYTGEVKALGFTDSATFRRNEARSLRKGATRSLIGGVVGTLGSTASGAARAFG